ncbi:MAG: beta/gamma crystallin-related protein [Thauera sp.]
MLRSTRSRSALSHLLGVAAVLAVAVAPGPLGAVERHMLRFCTEAGFDGRCVNITGNDRDLSQHRRFPARLSSVWVEPADGLWQLCDSPRYTGTCMVVTRSIGDLGATPLRHRVRSVRWATSEAELVPIVDVPGGVAGLGCSATIESRPLVGYEQEGFAGGCLGITGPERDLGRLGPNIIGLRVNAGQWRVCTEPDFGGQCQDVEASIPVLSPVFARRIRSILPLEPAMPAKP